MAKVDDGSQFAPPTGLSRVDNVYKTFAMARVDPDSATSREAFGDVHAWLIDEKRRKERWQARKAQIWGGAAVAALSAILSVFLPWAIHILTAAGKL